MKALTKPARVLLADDHVALLAQTINLLIGMFDIVGSVGNGLDLLEAATRLDPDVVVLDITMPGIDGIKAARRLHSAGCRAKLVFLTVHDDPDYVHAALQAGGSAYVVKSRLASDLVTAIREALAGQTFVAPTISLAESKPRGAMTTTISGGTESWINKKSKKRNKE